MLNVREGRCGDVVGKSIENKRGASGRQLRRGLGQQLEAEKVEEAAYGGEAERRRGHGGKRERERKAERAASEGQERTWIEDMGERRDIYIFRGCFYQKKRESDSSKWISSNGYWILRDLEGWDVGKPPNGAKRGNPAPYRSTTYREVTVGTTKCRTKRMFMKLKELIAVVSLLPRHARNPTMGTCRYLTAGTWK